MQLSIGDAASPSQVYSPRKQSNKKRQTAGALDINASILFQSAYWETELGPWRIPPDQRGCSCHRHTPCLLPLWAEFGLILHQNAERETNTQYTVNVLPLANLIIKIPLFSFFLVWFQLFSIVRSPALHFIPCQTASLGERSRLPLLLQSNVAVMRWMWFALDCQTSTYHLLLLTHIWNYHRSITCKLNQIYFGVSQVQKNQLWTSEEVYSILQ